MLLEVKMLVIPGERVSDWEGYEGGNVLVLVWVLVLGRMFSL